MVVWLSCSLSIQHSNAQFTPAETKFSVFPSYYSYHTDRCFQFLCESLSTSWWYSQHYYSNQCTVDTPDWLCSLNNVIRSLQNDRSGFNALQSLWPQTLGTPEAVPEPFMFKYLLQRYWNTCAWIIQISTQVIWHEVP